MIPESLPTVIEPFIKNTIYWDYCPSLDEVIWRHKNAFSELRYGLVNFDLNLKMCFYLVPYEDNYISYLVVDDVR